MSSIMLLFPTPFLPLSTFRSYISQSDTAPTNQIENCPITRSEIWYDDGSVVLQTEGTQFRVHWTILSSNSSVFREMNTQLSDRPRVEGCPVIKLFDAATDIHNLLKALYDPVLFSGELPFESIASMVRMGRKYDFKNILAVAVQRLMAKYPTFTVDNMWLFDHVMDCRHDTDPLTIAGNILGTITLATENKMHTVLPSAYYRAIMAYPLELILNGVSNPDGSVSTLSGTDQRTCILGCQKLLSAQWEQNQPWDWLNSGECSANCTDPVRCALEKKKILRLSLTSGALLSPQPGNGFCYSCRARHCEARSEGRRELWKKLPSFFDLPPWGQLKNDL